MFSGPERRWHRFSLRSSLNKVFCLKWMQLIPDLLSVTPGSPLRLLFVEEVRDSLFSERHQQEGRGSRYWSTSSPRLPLRMGWSVLICGPIRVTLFNTHTPPTHLSYYCRVCSSVYLSSSTPWMDFLLVSCFLLTQTQRHASLFEQAEVYYSKYSISPVSERTF